MGINLYVGGLFLACQKLCEVYIFHLEVIESQESWALIFLRLRTDNSVQNGRIQGWILRFTRVTN